MLFRLRESPMGFINIYKINHGIQKVGIKFAY